MYCSSNTFLPTPFQPYRYTHCPQITASQSPFPWLCVLFPSLKYSPPSLQLSEFSPKFHDSAQVCLLAEALKLMTECLDIAGQVIYVLA